MTLGERTARLVALVVAAAYFLVVSVSLRLTPASLLTFGAWVALLVLPVGVAALRVSHLVASPLTTAFMAPVLGFAIVGFASMLGSVVAGPVGLKSALAVVAGLVLGIRGMRRR